MADIEGSSCRIADEFMAQGRPSALEMVGKSLGALEVKTPDASHTYREWAVSEYNLEGGAKSGPIAPDDHAVKPVK